MPPTLPAETSEFGLGGCEVAAFDDATTAARFIERAYVGALGVVAVDGHWTLRHSRYGSAEFAIDDLAVSGSIELRAAPSAGVLVCQSLDGPLLLQHQGTSVMLLEGEPVLAAPGMPWTVCVTESRLRLTSVRSSVLARLADSLHRPLAESALHFRSGRVRPRMDDLWGHSVDYVTGVADGEMASAELVVETCARVLAAAALLCFPRAAAKQMPDALGSDGPDRLRMALAFVADNAREDIGIQEIADSVHLSPRAVQYLFRKHLDMTPTEYLRRVRLHGAHRDLVASDNVMTTVADVASKWRFGHTGRFAAAYRETFGNSPHFILRR